MLISKVRGASRGDSEAVLVFGRGRVVEVLAHVVVHEALRGVRENIKIVLQEDFERRVCRKNSEIYTCV